MMSHGDQNDDEFVDGFTSPLHILGETIDENRFLRFQYILNAATTPCSKINDESLTYLNQGQSYELKLKRLGDAITGDRYLRHYSKSQQNQKRITMSAMARGTETMGTWRDPKKITQRNRPLCSLRRKTVKYI
ncbi:hypothetical protein HELRODRAFT_175879 [Helobdella robusta]|uniref:Grh/CP2 DB domain-containing protein n=1 Tax=Helobdella robusta TaxID=6412 RepID=T1F9T7_HELRO|nr:hypothetical protein HELRODRAFT_175879 [Helobdella robusta]ESO00447.1 hypothetical protein HELRODRAFT_175879 [Helobdella robusta]